MPNPDTTTEAGPRLMASRAYRQMAMVSAVGIAVLAALGWVASRPRHDLEARARPTELLALTSGSVKEVLVQAGANVREGDVLLTLDDRLEQEALAAARRELDQIAAELQGTGIAVALPPAMGITGRIVTTGPLRGANPDGRPPSSGKLEPLPPAEGATDRVSALPTSKAPQDEREEIDLKNEIDALKAAAVEAQHKADQAATELEEALRNAAAGKGIADQRKREAEKMRMLLAEGAVSQVETSRAEALAASAQGGYEAAQRQADELGRLRDAYLAQASQASADAKAKEVELQALRKKASERAVAPKVDLPKVVPEPKHDAVRQPAFIQRDPAPPTPAKVTVDKSAKTQADAKMEAAKQRLDEAEKALASRTIRSPFSGKIRRVLVRSNDRVKPGTVLVEYEPVQRGGARTGPSGG